MSIINQTLDFYSFEKKEYEKSVKNFKSKQNNLITELQNLISFLHESKNTIEKMKRYKKFIVLMRSSIDVKNYIYHHNGRKFTHVDMRLFLSSFEVELKNIDENHFESFILGYINALYQIGIGFFGSFFEIMFEKKSSLKIQKLGDIKKT